MCLWACVFVNRRLRNNDCSTPFNPVVFFLVERILFSKLNYVLQLCQIFIIFPPRPSSQIMFDLYSEAICHPRNNLHVWLIPATQPFSKV